MWGLPTLLCFLHRGDLPLHASAVQVGDGALLIGAPARFGKTSLAAAFWRTGYRVLNEDLSCVRLPEPSVLPGPALLRMRLDMAERLGVAADPSAIDDGVRVRLAIGGDRAGDSRPVPLRGIVLPGRGVRRPDHDPRADRRGDPRALAAQLHPSRGRGRQPRASEG